MPVVWKYALSGPTSALVMPAAARIRAVGVQNSEIVVWAEVDPDGELTTRRFRAVNTGAKIDGDSLTYLGTIQMPNGIVWHVYEV